MAEPRYEPREYCAEPEAFGKAAVLRWHPPKDERSFALTRAAQIQHSYAVRIRSRAKAIAKGQVKPHKGFPLAAVPMKKAKAPLALLAEKMGTSYARLLRCLRGEVVMRLDDLAWADLVLGEISELAQPGRQIRTPSSQ
ncbi:hypothetical protein AB4Y63_12050 [Leifsonia sp. YAF41]|uniref:hypothetical protein n=1 Tax=Leifsonia sp. YAF41 TaxID=3233086 RepID=UPI003F959FB1